MKVVFISRGYNDIDHNSPIIEKLLEKNYKVLLLNISNKSVMNDFRVKHNLKKGLELVDKSDILNWKGKLLLRLPYAFLLCQLIGKISDIKFLKSNKIFLLSVERTKVESGEEYKKVNSICKFDFVDRVKSKNIDQKNKDFLLELIGINYLKNKDDHEINLIFNNNSHISLTTDTIEVRLEDQYEVK